ncbi:MAG: DUF2314 domain-containing protein [Candidatus Anammoximicrobium sp.]|nr:DUF2314 domain-containing protein [Candidatus Anammoximicrobium sp.]
MTSDAQSDAQVQTATDSAQIPVGAWLRLDLPGQPGLIAFTYLDRQAGFFAQGRTIEGAMLDRKAATILRLPLPGVCWQPLSAAEVRALGLDTPPNWLQGYGPQPTAGTVWGAWREHPELKGRFHPEYPDDVQVVIHDGGPRRTENRLEVVWLRVSWMDGDVMQGRVLNQPVQLQTVRRGSQIRCLVADAIEYPVMVTDQYLQERSDWIIRPCDECGFSELFDAPSDLIRAESPTAPTDAEVGEFSAVCPLCGGIQVVMPRKSLAS